MIIEKGKPLSLLTTYAIGGPADWFCSISSMADLRQALAWAKKRDIPYYIIGAGSNILVADKGIRGLVIKFSYQKLKVLKAECIEAGAGVMLSKLLVFAWQKKLSGLEFLAGIPGSVGGSVAGNAGPKDKPIAQVVKSVSVLNKKGKIIKYKKADCCFSYRQSRFTKSAEIILTVVFGLKTGEKEKIKKQMILFLKARQHQPKSGGKQKLKSAGSVFKNPKGRIAGELIDKAGLKGTKVGGAMISLEHANFIVNTGQARASDVLKLINLVKLKVKNKFNVDLETEIKLLGDF